MANKSDILSKDGNHLSLLYDGNLQVDTDLPKYSLIKKEVEDFKKKKNKPSNDYETEEMIDPSLFVMDSFQEADAIKDLLSKDYEQIKDGDIRSVNIFINKHLFNDIFSVYNEHNSFISITPNEIFADGNQISNMSISADVKKKSKKHSLLKKMSELMKLPQKEQEETYVLDVLDFFSQVKGLTKESRDTYVNRLTGYIVALKNCDTSGQKALKEKLVRDMVINKYESVLYAREMYYAITENQVVEFVKKTKKGVRLTYIKNYMRVIPPEIVEKINDVNRLEIFDNYAILHYDPDLKAYSETIEETKRRRDPILFGLIKGSNKLYYITDWIDEFCDLTLDKFVETLQTNKDAFKLSAKI